MQTSPMVKGFSETEMLTKGKKNNFLVSSLIHIALSKRHGSVHFSRVPLRIHSRLGTNNTNSSYLLSSKTFVSE